MQQPIQLTVPSGAKTVDRYDAESFTVSGDVIAGDILITPALVRPICSVTMAALTPESFAEVFALSPKPNVLLFGTGAVHLFVAPAIRQYFRTQGIGLETMDTGSAVRTYNILLAEGRDIAGLFLKNSLLAKSSCALKATHFT